MKQKRRHGHGRRLLEIGKDILIVFLVLVNVTLAIMCLPTKTLTQTKWLASALRPFAGLFGLNEAELTYTAPATGSAFIGAAQPVAVTLSTEAGRPSIRSTGSTEGCLRRRSKAPRRRRRAPNRRFMPLCGSPARPSASRDKFPPPCLAHG